MRTPFQPDNGGGRSVTLDLPDSLDHPCLCFVLHHPESDTWDNNDGQDYCLDLPGLARRLNAERIEMAIEQQAQPPFAVGPRLIALNEREQLGLAVTFEGQPGESAAVVHLVTDCHGKPHLHWGLSPRRGGEWSAPSGAARTATTQQVDDRAARTPFEPAGDGLWEVTLSIPPDSDGGGRWLQAVIYEADGNRWLKDGTGDIAIPLFEAGTTDLDSLVQRIVEQEVGDHSWTLMHRFHLAHDLLDEAGTDGDALELIFIWLRFSAIRQLDWQRRYNTQPRELAAAQDRLTRRLSRLYREAPEARPVVRRILGQVGRGGPGQEVRDGVLNIMHRHRIKELHGTWLEQWHQKLHNNTTPDDIVICQAFIDFLRADGDVAAYDRALERGGIDRERLASFDRPITTTPEFFPDRKDGLIHDLEHFLRVLKTVHAGTDLETSIDLAAGSLGHQLTEQFRAALHPWGEGTDEMVRQVQRLTAARWQLAERIEHEGDDSARRGLLYLDISTEAHLRTVTEQLAGIELTPGQCHTIAAELLGNLAFSEGEQVYAASRDDWPANAPDEQAERESLLYQLAIVERAGRSVREACDRLYQHIQPRAEQLGQALKVEQWTLTIFGEEIVRGSLAFILGRVLRRYERHLYKALELPGWQTVSNPGPVEGVVRQFNSLHEIQGKQIDGPTIARVQQVGGEEDIPPQIRAIVTTQAPDVLSHVAIRARNGGVLVIGCLDETMLEPLESHDGQHVQLSIAQDGSLNIREAEGAGAPSSKSTRRKSSRKSSEKKASSPSITPPEVDPTPAVLLPDQFDPKRTGGKALTLSRLRQQVDASIHMPASLSLSYGVFEQVLEDSINREVASQYARKCAAVDEQPESYLPSLRDLIRKLKAPASLTSEIATAAEKQALELPPWDELWPAITGVWASKWGDRAYWARRHAGLDHGKLHVAVLIQQAVAADLAFVLHTTNPLSGSADELYGNVVLGLGETLAANHPGRPLIFIAERKSGNCRLDALPSKSTGLFGGGIICRSDSNGEDLPGFAGAGLYDSIFVPAPQTKLLRYRKHPLVTDADWRASQLRAIAGLGWQVEAALGSPQDIEGAVAGDELYLLQSRPQVGLRS